MLPNQPRPVAEALDSEIPAPAASADPATVDPEPGAPDEFPGNDFVLETDTRYPQVTSAAPPPQGSTAPGGLDFVPVPAARIVGYIDGLTISGATSQFTSSTELTQFATGDMKIPPVTSGSPLAAVDLAWQLAGNSRFAQFVNTNVSGTYWSLQGHEGGFDVIKQNLVTGRDESVYRLFHEKYVDGIPQGAVYRCWRVRDSYTSQGWLGYHDGIYSTAGLGSSASVRPGTRTHIMATTRPGDSPVRFVFGTSFTDLGYGPNGEKEGYGKYFTVSLDHTALTIEGQYRKTDGTPSGPVKATVSALPLSISATQESIIQILIGLEWTDANTFVVSAYAADTDFNSIKVSLPMTSTGNDVYSAPWKHVGAIRGLFVQTVDVSDPDQAIANRVGPYERTLPLRSTLPNWGLDPAAPILGMTGGLWDYLTQVAVAKQVDARSEMGDAVITSMEDVAYSSLLWDPAVSPSVSLGVNNTSKFMEVVYNRTKWSPRGVTLYDARKKGDSFSVSPGVTQDFSVTTSAEATLYYNPAPVGNDSSITQDMYDAMKAEQDAPGYKATAPGPAEIAVQNASVADATKDFTEFTSEAAHGWGAYVVTGTFAGVANHTMPAREWIAFGGAVQVTPVDDTNLKVTVTAPAIPGWTGDYTLGFSDGANSYPAVRLVGNGLAYTQETRRFATGANPKTTNTEVGQTITNIAATSMKIVNTLAMRAVSEAAGPSLQLSGTVSMAEVHEWGVPVGLIPGSSVLYNNMQWRITSTTLSNASVAFTAAPFTTYHSAYWAYNWQGVGWDTFLTYWAARQYDDYKVEPLSGAVADWGNKGGLVKQNLFPLPDPNDPSIPLEPADDLLPNRFLLPYAGTGLATRAAFPSETLFPSG